VSVHVRLRPLERCNLRFSGTDVCIRFYVMRFPVYVEVPCGGGHTSVESKCITPWSKTFFEKLIVIHLLKTHTHTHTHTHTPLPAFMESEVNYKVYILSLDSILDQNNTVHIHSILVSIFNIIVHLRLNLWVLSLPQVYRLELSAFIIYSIDAPASPVSYFIWSPKLYLVKIISYESSQNPFFPGF
jgi:hypothetical protein